MFWYKQTNYINIQIASCHFRLRATSSVWSLYKKSTSLRNKAKKLLLMLEMSGRSRLSPDPKFRTPKIPVPGCPEETKKFIERCEDIAKEEDSYIAVSMAVSFCNSEVQNVVPPLPCVTCCGLSSLSLVL